MKRNLRRLKEKTPQRGKWIHGYGLIKINKIPVPFFPPAKSHFKNLNTKQKQNVYSFLQCPKSSLVICDRTNYDVLILY